MNSAFTAKLLATMSITVRKRGLLILGAFLAKPPVAMSVPEAEEPSLAEEPIPLQPDQVFSILIPDLTLDRPNSCQPSTASAILKLGL
jgi:hypothetical protein